MSVSELGLFFNICIRASKHINTVIVWPKCIPSLNIRAHNTIIQITDAQPLGGRGRGGKNAVDTAN